MMVNINKYTSKISSSSILKVYFFENLHKDVVHVKQRTILWYLVFVGFSVNYMIRINVNIAIVDMLDNSDEKLTSNNGSSVTSECFVKNYSSILEINNDVTLSSKEGADQIQRFPSFERIILDSFGVNLNFLSIAISNHHIIICHTLEFFRFNLS
jgi:hypothetical protein